MSNVTGLGPYRRSLAGTLLAAREAVMAPIRPILRDAGVTEQQWRVLRVLTDEGAIDPSRLAEAAILHPPSVTRILRELIDRELIERMTDPNDRRRSIVSATKQGRALVEATARHTRLVLKEVGRQYGTERLDALLEELRALAAAVANGSDDATRGAA